MEKVVNAPLDPRVIEREIARIREKEANPFASGTKTNLFTLLMFRSEGAADPGAADPVELALHYLLGRRPARIITITRARAARTEAWVSGRCFPDRRNRGVCFEEVRIESGDDGLGADPGAWAPIVIRDLPVFAWIADRPPEGSEPWERVVVEAAGLIDKLLVDSSRPERGPEESDAVLPALCRLREKTADAFLLSDFSWRRGRILREQTARAFDPPGMRPLLSSVRSVRLHGGSPPEASLFFGWLRARLGRNLRADHAADTPLPDGFHVTFAFDGAPDLDIGCTKGGCLSRGEQKSAYRFPSDGEILLEEVDSLTRDPVFLEALAQAGQSGA
jgi:hypothetical protein